MVVSKEKITKEKYHLWYSTFPELGNEYFENSTEKTGAYLLKYKMIGILRLYQIIRNIYRKFL